MADTDGMERSNSSEFTFSPDSDEDLNRSAPGSVKRSNRKMSSDVSKSSQPKVSQLPRKSSNVSGMCSVILSTLCSDRPFKSLFCSFSDANLKGVGSFSEKPVSEKPVSEKPVSEKPDKPPPELRPKADKG